MKNEVTKEYLEVGKAVVALTKTWPTTILIVGFLFPIFAKKMHRFTAAMIPLVKRGDFGSDEQLGL